MPGAFGSAPPGSCSSRPLDHARGRTGAAGQHQAGTSAPVPLPLRPRAGKLTALHVVQRGSKFGRIDLRAWQQSMVFWLATDVDNVVQRGSQACVSATAGPGPPPELIAPWRHDGAQFPDPVAGFLVMRRQHLPRPLRHLDVGRDAQEHRSLGLAQLERLGWSAPCQRLRAGRSVGST